MHLKITQHFLITAIVLLSVFISKADAQQVTWGLRFGGSATDYVEDSHVDAAGNVFICGEFRGTNIDFDPGPGTALLSSNGGCDGFLAEYTAAGQYIRSFSIGGSNLDKINSIGTDNAGNIYITGYFRGANVDFDPSAAGTALLNSNGELGSDNGFGGDIFVAKYSPTGQYLWAFNVGGTSLGDNGLDLKVDGAGGVYVSGFFRENIDFDPSAAVHNLDANTGTAFLAKYNTSGVYQWALNVGAGNTDNVIYDSHLDPAGNIYVCGFFQGNNIDFDPSVAGTAILNCAGLLDGFVAKYTSTGQYLNVIQIGGPGYDAARGFVVDNASNIYVVGDFSNTVDFDPSPAVSNLNSNGSTDVFLVKYNAAGQLGWSFNVGSPGQELGWRIGTDNNNLFVTGSYFGVTDFNPAAAVDNVTSNGGADIFLAKYDFSGNYVCAFGIGSSADDYGYEILNTGTDAFYLSGFFQGTNTDFAPTASTYNMTSSGAEDGFLVKYLWPPNTLATGNVTGNTICASGTGQLTFTATAGTSPFHYHIQMEPQCIRRQM
ncbi:MAG: SBBP repeat-containing protein [Chitinophagaceae bacterium]|nr:SBBP repeat-containing protein [Chitinophagaceae bacterium]